MPVKKSFFKSALSFESKILANYKYQLERQNERLETIKSALPDPLSEHALHCVVSNNTVILFTDSAIWSSQLRFYQRDILQTLSNSGSETFKTLKIKIIAKTKVHSQGKTLHHPSTENIELILNMSADQTDKTLQLALSKLGKTLKKLT